MVKRLNEDGFIRVLHSAHLFLSTREEISYYTSPEVSDGQQQPVFSWICCDENGTSIKSFSHKNLSSNRGTA